MEKDELWNNMLSLMLEGSGDNDPKSVFLNMLTPVGIFGDQFVLIAQSSQVESWVSKNYLEEMTATAAQVYGAPLKIGIATTDTPQPAPAAQIHKPTPTQSPQMTTPKGPLPYTTQSDVPDWMNAYMEPVDDHVFQEDTTPTRPMEKQRVSGNYAAANRGEDTALFSKCTFDTFVVGKSNKFARGAALAVAEQPGTVYNPLFIYGNSGLGKTHLLVAIANYVRQNYPSLTTRYVSANQFLNDYVEATQKNQWGAFNVNYHQADVLLVDDVQYLEGKDETINQLFNIFNEMTGQNRQIVLSADRAPRDIDMDDRMRSRFASGLLADVKPPDYETRLAIMRNYLTRVGNETNFFGIVPEDVLAYLAETSTSNIREMEGAITRLVSHMSLLGKQSITVDDAKEILQDFFPNATNNQIDIATIQQVVERYFDITHEDMISSKRSKGITTPRHIAIYLSRYLTEESLESIGKKFGGRDHTTVMHSVNKIEREQQNNRVLYDQINQLTTRIKERS